MTKVVIDTNVLLDADFDELSYTNKIVEAVIAGEIEAYANRETKNENKLLARRVERSKEHSEKLDRFFAALLPVDSLDLEVVEGDQEDNKILASAVAAYLITSDRHLLSLGDYQGVAIVRPGVFWHRYQDDQGQNWLNFIKDFLHD
jgi:uncharacterized protein